MTRLNLSQALTSPDTGGKRFARVSLVHTDSGLVDVDFGGGEYGYNCLVDASYTPAVGQSVYVERFNNSLWLVKGGIRSANPATITVGARLGIPFNIAPVTPAVANPLVVSTVSTGSWLSGWSGTGLPASDSVGQGAPNILSGYYRGCYFYGDNAFTVLRGRKCTRLRVRFNRLGTGGSSGVTKIVVAPHASGTQPSGAPYFTADWVDLSTIGGNAAGLAQSTNGTFDLPPSWGDQLISGVAKGIGHLLLAAGSGSYAIFAGRTADSLSGRITLDWT